MGLNEKDWEGYIPAVNTFIKTVLLQVCSFWQFVLDAN